MRTGTCHFESLNRAFNYYSKQGISTKGVLVKVRTEEIVIGPPSLKNGQSMGTDEDGRYWIEDNKP